MKLLQTNQGATKAAAKELSCSMNKVIRGKVPKELTTKYLELLLSEAEYSLAVCRKASENADYLLKHYRLSSDGEAMVASVFNVFFTIRKVNRELRTIVKSFGSYDSYDEFIADVEKLRRQLRPLYF